VGTAREILLAPSIWTGAPLPTIRSSGRHGRTLGSSLFAASLGPPKIAGYAGTRLSPEKVMKTLIPLLCFGFLVSIGFANPQAQAAPIQRSARSIECSKQADAKGLHGKQRQVFRRKCKKGQS
jgi:hypothetical protein